MLNKMSRHTLRLAAILGLGALAMQPAAAKSIGDEAMSMGACPAKVPAGEHLLQLELHDLRSAKGRATLDFYGDNPNDFLAKGKKIIKIHVPAAKSLVKACLKLPHAGRYAIAGYHDENDNHHFDRTLVGMPEEGYTFSRDPDALIVPSYKDTAFEAKKVVTVIPLHFHYP